MIIPLWTNNDIGEKEAEYGPLKLMLTATYCKYFRHLYCISTVSVLCIVSSPLLSPACLPVRQLPIPPPRRPNILALHKFLMSVLKSPATSTHWWLNLLRQTNTTAYTCFCTFLAALTLHMQYSKGQAWRCWKANGCSCRQLQDCSFFYPGGGKKGQKRHDTRQFWGMFYWLPVWPCLLNKNDLRTLFVY